MNIKSVTITMDDGKNYIIKPEYINSITMETNMNKECVIVNIEFIAPEALIAYKPNSKLIREKIKLLSGSI